MIHYPMLHVDAPANLGVMQAALKKMATFELVDDSVVKETLWEDYDVEEEVSFWMENSGYDSN